MAALSYKSSLVASSRFFIKVTFFILKEISNGKCSKKGTIRGRLSKNSPNPVDIHVGNRIKLRRNVLGYSQQQMAKLLGLTFQQIQKYEKGLNRVGASRLYDISRILKVSMDFFFTDMEEKIKNQSPMMISEKSGVRFLSQNTENTNPDPMKTKETLELVRAYYQFKKRQPKAAQNLFNMLVCLSKSDLYNF